VVTSSESPMESPLRVRGDGWQSDHHCDHMTSQQPSQAFFQGKPMCFALMGSQFFHLCHRHSVSGQQGGLGF